MEGTPADARTDRETKGIGIPLRDTRALPRKKNESVLFACREGDCLRLCTLKEESEGMNEDFFLFLHRVFAHAVEKAFDMVLFFGAREIVREANHNGIFPDKRPGMLVFRAFNAVSGRAVFHEEGAVYDRSSVSSTDGKLQKFCNIFWLFLDQEISVKNEIGWMVRQTILYLLF